MFLQAVLWKTTLIYGEFANFGEIVETKDPLNISTKLDSHGRICMFLGYSEDHTQKVYRILNLNTRKDMYSRDTQWMNTMYMRACRNQMQENS